MKLPQPEEFSDAEKDDWIKNQVEILMSEGQDCYPFTPDNIQEAICQMDLSNMQLFSHYIKSANNEPSTVINVEHLFLADFIVAGVKRYWKEIAEVKADKSFSERH